MCIVPLPDTQERGEEEKKGKGKERRWKKIGGERG